MNNMKQINHDSGEHKLAGPRLVVDTITTNLTQNQTKVGLDW